MAQLAQQLIEISGYKLEIVYDTTRPNGQPRRSCDSSRAQTELGFQTRISLQDGLERTFAYYRRKIHS